MSVHSSLQRDDSLEDLDLETLTARLFARGATLSVHEVAWRARQPFLESHGYMLRPRLRPGWIPSWNITPIAHPLDAEDFHASPTFRPNIIDATRIADGKLVFVKRIRTDKGEGTIAAIFSQPPLKDDPRNHCIQVLDTFEDEADSDYSYLIMPFFRHTDDPPFSNINDIVELADQLFEGLLFMHTNRVAHRDCAHPNLMMDATMLYPEGFHPILSDESPDLSARAKVRSRYLAPRPVKYYFVDFGISSHFPPDVAEPKVTGEDGLDKEVPELSLEIPYDPFKVDIFVLGNFFKQRVYQKFSNVEFLKPLIESMTSQDPAARPDAKTVLKRWRKIRGGVGILRRGMLLESRTEHDTADVKSDIWTMLNLAPVVLKHELRSTARWFQSVFRFSATDGS